jgi:6-phosphogluconolactonase
MSDYLVYIGTYTNGESKSEGIYIYRLDMQTGGLNYIATTQGIDDPSFVEITAGRKVAYVASEVAESNGIPGGGLAAYSIDQETGSLRFLNMESTHGAYPCHVSIDRTGSYVLVANYMGGNVAVLPINEDGSLGPATDVVQHSGHSNVIPDRQEGPHAHSVTMTPDNRFAMVADFGKDELLVYSLDVQTGKLIPTPSPIVEIGPGQGPRHLDFHPNGKHLYLLNELGSAIDAFNFDPGSAVLRPINSVNMLPDDFQGENIAADIHVHPNGKFLYGSNRGHDSLVICSIDQSDGSLKVIEFQKTMGAHPRNFAIDPTGTFLLVANRDSNSITTFVIDPETGQLSPNGQVTSVPQPVCVKLIPAFD